MPGPRRTPVTADQKSQVNAENLPPIDVEAREAFNSGIKRRVKPRGNPPIELVIRHFYTDQALEIVDQLEVVFTLIQGASNAEGNVDLMGVFREAKDEVFAIVLKALDGQIDRPMLGKLEIDDLLTIFGDVFNINKDFFALRVKNQLSNLVRAYTML